ncbi:unnamed protein product [Orchesella dallaii]|uniref:Ubiquitin-like protease family profile domain-containing protein n=1 Tax=Orchesella dallaii TaxID=48710 RepID=A0ABP1RHS6_9HEXA
MDSLSLPSLSILEKTQSLSSSVEMTKESSEFQHETNIEIESEEKENYNVLQENESLHEEVPQMVLDYDQNQSSDLDLQRSNAEKELVQKVDKELSEFLNSLLGANTANTTKEKISLEISSETVEFPVKSPSEVSTLVEAFSPNMRKRQFNITDSEMQPFIKVRRLTSQEIEVYKQDLKTKGKTINLRRSSRSRSLQETSLVKPESCPELTNEMLTKNSEALVLTSTSNSTSIIVQSDSCKIIRKDFVSLKGRRFLSDPIVDFYLQLIQIRSIENEEYPKIYCFFSTFYTLLSSANGLDNLRESRYPDIFLHDLIFFPVCSSAHWRLIVVDPLQKTIRPYNSCIKDFKDRRICKKLRRFLRFQERILGDLSANGVNADWVIQNGFDEDSIPQQENGWDCGVFMLQYAEYLSRQQNSFDFSQENMRYFREKIMNEILEQRLLTSDNDINNNYSPEILDNQSVRKGSKNEGMSTNTPHAFQLNKSALNNTNENNHNDIDIDLIRSLQKKFSLDNSPVPKIVLEKIDQVSKVNSKS